MSEHVHCTARPDKYYMDKLSFIISSDVNAHQLQLSAET